MTVSVKSAWILRGLIALGTILAGGQEALAKGIVVTGVQAPGTGDPPYDYIFQVYLTPGSTILPPSLGPTSQDYFTIDNLPGVTTGSLSSVILGPGFMSPENSWAYPTITPTTNPYPGPPSYAADVEWSYNGLSSITNDGTSNLLLGQFTIITTYDFNPGPPVVSGTLIDYSWDIDGGKDTGSGQFPLYTVPEPSSVVLLLAGIGGGLLPVIWHRGRRQRQSNAG